MLECWVEGLAYTKLLPRSLPNPCSPSQDRWNSGATGPPVARALGQSMAEVLCHNNLVFLCKTTLWQGGDSATGRLRSGMGARGRHEKLKPTPHNLDPKKARA